MTEALQPILDGFRWLGLDWDEGAEVGGPHGPYYQSQKLERYQTAARTLVERGFAYYDYATPEELQAEREAAEKEKRSFLYSRTWMAATPQERARYEAEGRKGVVRLKMPREGACRFVDRICGQMEVKWATEQDHVVQRADGTCLYNLANVVDDQDMVRSGFAALLSADPEPAAARGSSPTAGTRSWAAPSTRRTHAARGCR